MKTKLNVWCVMVALGCGAVAQNMPNSDKTSSASAVKAQAVLGVNTFMRGVDGYHGRVQVEGIAKTISAKNKTLGLVDKGGCEKCEQGGCVELTLPVHWAGAMPSVGQAVRVSGEVQKKKGKLVFVATEVEKLPMTEKKK